MCSELFNDLLRPIDAFDVILPEVNRDFSFEVSVLVQIHQNLQGVAVELVLSEVHSVVLAVVH